MSPAALTQEIEEALRRRANPAVAEPMARYMRNRFSFLGLKRPDYRPLLPPWKRAMRDWPEGARIELAQRLWRLPEREFHYVAMELLDPRRLTPVALPALRELLEAHSWWDSVDGLVGYVIGPLVGRERRLQKQMDAWSRDENFWIRRAAILHQLGFKQTTDVRRLFAYCTRNAHDGEFFIRKAIGWALRTHARVDLDAVRDYVQAHPELSALSRKEALKHA